MSERGKDRSAYGLSSREPTIGRCLPVASPDLIKQLLFYGIARWPLQQESNLHLSLRRTLFYPLNYGVHQWQEEYSNWFRRLN